MRILTFILFSCYLTFNANAQTIIINGEKGKTIIDTISESKDTLCVKVKFYYHDRLLYSRIIKGTKFSYIHRPWKSILGVPLIPQARRREEGIYIKEQIRFVPGLGEDSLFYSSARGTDSIMVGNKTIWSKPARKPSDPMTIICDVPVHILKSTKISDERKKKRNKQRKK